MRRHIIELAATPVFAGAMLVAIAVLTGKENSWTIVASILVATAGGVGLVFACRRDTSIAVRAKRIVAPVLLCVLVPILGGVASAAADSGAWGMVVGAVLAFALVGFGLSRLTPHRRGEPAGDHQIAARALQQQVPP